MDRVLSQSTAGLIKEHWGETGLCFPIAKDRVSEALLILLQFFTNLEGSLSMDEDEGKAIDEKILNDVTKAVDELNLDSEDFIDFDKLQKQISA